MTTNKKYDISYRQGALMSAIQDFDQYMSGEEVIHYSIVSANAESSQKRYMLELNKRIKQLPKKIFDYYFHSDSKNKTICLLASLV